MSRLASTQARLLACLVAAYLAIGALYAVYTPPWQVPDEPAHYNYVRTLATTGQFPIIEAGDYDQEYQNRLVFETRFSAGLSIDPLRYEDWQPPLYYALAAPVFALAGGSLAALRLLSVLLGAGVVILAFLIARPIYPARPAVALGTAAFVAFLPQHVAMMAGVNNDSLAELLLAAVMWNALRTAQASDKSWALTGMLLGLGMITKLSFYIAIPLVAWVFLRQARSSSVPRAVVRRLAWTGLPALLIAGPWWVRNLVVYGWPDFMGQARHAAIVAAAGQPTSIGWIEQYGWGSLLQRFFTFTFQSFWGQFGWMTVLMPTHYYLALGALSAAALAGLAWAWAARLRGAPKSMPSDHLQLMGVWIALNVLMYLYYNLTFVQHQGRYLFLALIPIGLAFTVGLSQWTTWPRLGRWRDAALALPYVGLVILDLLALFRMIVPALKA